MKEFNVYINGYCYGSVRAINKKNAKKRARRIYENKNEGLILSALYEIKQDANWNFESYEHRPLARGGKTFFGNH